MSDWRDRNDFARGRINRIFDENKIPTPEQFAEMMKIASEEFFDEEYAHIEMDFIMERMLARLGYEKGVKIFANTPKWYS